MSYIFKNITGGRMNLRALLVFVLCGIPGAIVGWGVSWLTGLGIVVVIGVAIGSGLGGMIFATEKSEKQQLVEDLDQMEALADYWAKKNEKE
jgi:uncharacterized membrane protein YfcA